MRQHANWAQRHGVARDRKELTALPGEFKRQWPQIVIDMIPFTEERVIKIEAPTQISLAHALRPRPTTLFEL